MVYNSHRMNVRAVAAVSWMPQVASEDLFSEISIVLMMLAGALFFYRTFREKYLLAWILGWTAFLIHKLAIAVSGHAAGLAISCAAYGIAVALFAIAIFSYIDKLRMLLPVCILAAVGIDLWVMRVFWWPHSSFLLVTGSICYLLIRALGAVELVLFNHGRRDLAPWLLVVGLALLPMHTGPRRPDVFPGELILYLVLGFGMLLMLLDESHERGERLRAVQAITRAIATSPTHEPVLQVALEQLQRAARARAVWLRVLQAKQLVMLRQIGLSDAYVRERMAVDGTESVSARALQQREPVVMNISEADPETQARLRAQGVGDMVILPVEGKNSVWGTLVVGMERHRRYTADELRFFGVVAQQVGIAVENLRLLDQTLRSQQQWANTFDSIEDCILVHDDTFRIIKVNHALTSRLGVGAEALLQQECEAALPRLEPWQACPYCWRVVSKFGQAEDPCLGGFSQVSTSSYQEADGGRRTIHVVKDITEHREAEERYRLFFERVQEGTFVSTPDGQLLDCNQALVRMLGYDSREELLQVDITRDLYLSPQQRAVALRHIEDQDFVRNFEVTLRRKDGTPIHVQESSFAIRDAAGAVLRYQGFLLNVTEKKRAEEEMHRRNRELFALNSIAVIANESLDLDEILRLTLNQVVELFRADSGAVYLFDERTLKLHRRAGRGQLTAGPIQELQISREFWERLKRLRPPVISRQHLAHLPQEISNYVRDERLEAWIWVILWAQDKAAGVLGIASRTPREFSATDENLMIAIGRQLANTIEKVRLYEETRRAYEDLTRTQEQLLQSEKMSALGQMISGVAHELNNPLTAILGYAQLLDDEPLEPRHREYLDKIFKQTQRTHRIVQNLLSFSRQRKPYKQPLDLRRVLEDTLALRDYDLKLNNIGVEQEVAAELPQVIGDAHQLEQVFLNIVNNALDAMLEAGASRRLRVRVFPDQVHVCVEFHDSGGGIRDPKRIFDPFYTTKAVGKGTGLGLSICYGIVKSHGGEILARNHPEGGAVFQVRLPVAGQAAEPQPAPAAPSARMLLQGRLLLVDDEEPVLELEREALTYAGAEVVTISSFEEAIACLQAERFDAVIADGRMSGGTAMDLYRWISINRRGLEKHFVLAASSPGDPELRFFVEQTRILCIAKPFTVPEFLDLVRRALQPSAPGVTKGSAIFT